MAAIKAEATETAQTFAKVGIYADQRIGEILRELPTKPRNQYTDALSSVQDKATKTEAIKDAGITHSQAYDLQALAAMRGLFFCAAVAGATRMPAHAHASRNHGAHAPKRARLFSILKTVGASVVVVPIAERLRG